METQGIMVFCPRCNATYFREQFRAFEKIERYSSNRSDFKPLPDDWLWVEELSGHLCPACTDDFRELIDQFMGDNKDYVAPKWRLKEKRRTTCLKNPQ